MNLRNLFIDRVLIKDPVVLIREDMPRNDFRYISVIKRGDFYIVKPCKAKEVFYIQLLTKDIDRFVPAEGEGIIVTRSSIEFL
jgi:hypothetical protein|tara:strand:- start:3919 stop:4167 length:249 start_codon:yes stop_codon:yes gene_type:complete